MKKQIIYSVLVLLLVLQFFQPDRSVPSFEVRQDFLVEMQPPQDIARMFRTACYDCHSYQTYWPWYSYIQPIGWFLANHVREARTHLNLSKWGLMSIEDQLDALEEMSNAIEEGWMPLNSYTFMHAQANLSEAQRAAIVNWLRQTQPTVVE